MKDTNPTTFRYLGNGYSVDRQNAHFQGEKIPGADGDTFKMIDGPEIFFFAVDKNYVYRHNQIFKEADPSTFYYKGKYIFGDKDQEWQYTPPTSMVEI